MNLLKVFSDECTSVAKNSLVLFCPSDFRPAIDVIAFPAFGRRQPPVILSPRRGTKSCLLLQWWDFSECQLYVDAFAAPICPDTEVVRGKPRDQYAEGLQRIRRVDQEIHHGNFIVDERPLQNQPGHPSQHDDRYAGYHPPLRRRGVPRVRHALAVRERDGGDHGEELKEAGG